MSWKCKYCGLENDQWSSAYMMVHSCPSKGWVNFDGKNPGEQWQEEWEEFRKEVNKSSLKR